MCVDPHHQEPPLSFWSMGDAVQYAVRQAIAVEYQTVPSLVLPHHQLGLPIRIHMLLLKVGRIIFIFVTCNIKVKPKTDNQLYRKPIPEKCFGNTYSRGLGDWEKNCRQYLLVVNIDIILSKSFQIKTYTVFISRGGVGNGYF